MKIQYKNTLSEQETSSLFEWGEDIFNDTSYQLSWRPPDLHIVAYKDGAAVSHMGVLKHLIKVGETDVLVGGFVGFVTRPEVQGQGYGFTLFKAAEEFIFDTYQVDSGLFFCIDSLMSLYERYQWKKLNVPVFIEQGETKVESPLNVMILPRPGFQWPTGAVDLQSLPW